jgi:hypothetical protein
MSRVFHHLLAVFLNMMLGVKALVSQVIELMGLSLLGVGVVANWLAC